MLFIAFALVRVCHGPQEYMPLSPFLGPPCAASPAPSPARRRCGGTANEAGQGHWDNHLSATVGDPAQRSCWPGRLNPGVFPAQYLARIRSAPAAPPISDLAEKTHRPEDQEIEMLVLLLVEIFSYHKYLF